ncbi:MAG: amidase [Deltaproteobacteria bacterium]|nr:amidase [Deltaproteobacteria bacterium]
MDGDGFCYVGMRELSEGIEKGEVSPVEVTEAHLRRIESLNPELLAFITVTADQAMDAAKVAEKEVNAGRWRGPMHGIPFGVKDIVNTAGILTTNGSSFHRDNVPAEDAEIIRRLKSAGGILLGKTHTHEFAAAATTINPHYGTTRNPWNRECIVGGSSGGSAAAVAAGMCRAAIGTDTGGSIRGPAGLCGIVGLKPTLGLVGLRGICPNVPSFDHPGPMTATAYDAGLMLQALAGFDPLDSMSRDRPVPEYNAEIDKGVKGFKILLCPDFYGNTEVDAQVQTAMDGAVEVFRDLGATVEEVPFPHYQSLMDLWRVIAGPEFAEFHRPFFEENPDGYGEDVKERLDWSLQVTLDEYVRGLRDLVPLRREAEKFFRGADALITPALPCVAPPIDTLMTRINGREVPYDFPHRPFLTVHNITGFPALVTPMGFSREGMPLSLQIVGGFIILSMISVVE